MLSSRWWPMNMSQLWLFNIQTVDHIRVLSPILVVCCVSRQHKDLALVNMANILHRAHFSADAAIVAHTALDLTSDLLTSHYTLGNIYAVSYSTTSRCTEYNPRDNTLKRFHLFPSWFLMEYTQDRQNHRKLAVRHHHLVSSTVAALSFPLRHHSTSCVVKRY
jgi:hypothetical protein